MIELIVCENPEVLFPTKITRAEPLYLVDQVARGSGYLELCTDILKMLWLFRSDSIVMTALVFMQFF